MRILPADVELLEAETWATLHGSFANKAGGQAATVKRWGRAAALVTRDVAVAAVNRAIGFGFDRALDQQQLAEIWQFYRDSGKARWFLERSPSATMDDTMLAEAGGIIGGTVLKLVAELADLPELPVAAFEVVEATAQDATTFMGLVGPLLGVPEPGRPGIVATMGEPGWRFYFALIESRPIAGAAMFLGGDGAWLGLAGTLPAYRHRGAQTALLSRRILDARATACRWISAETSPEALGDNPSLRNMKRLGLRELYHRPWYRFTDPRELREP